MGGRGREGEARESARGSTRERNAVAIRVAAGERGVLCHEAITRAAVAAVAQSGSAARTIASRLQHRRAGCLAQFSARLSLDPTRAQRLERGRDITLFVFALQWRAAPHVRRSSPLGGDVGHSAHGWKLEGGASMRTAEA